MNFAAKPLTHFLHSLAHFLQNSAFLWLFICKTYRNGLFQSQILIVSFKQATVEYNLDELFFDKKNDC